MSDTKKSVTRQDIAAHICQATAMSTKDANAVLDHVVEAISESLRKGDDVMISGFGKFVVKDKDSRMGRNPKTGEAVSIPARRVMKFKPSDLLKNSLNSNMFNK